MTVMAGAPPIPPATREAGVARILKALRDGNSDPELLEGTAKVYFSYTTHT